ncbi:MAG: hypothetical protein PVG93_06505 [Phycisphaerales bacterium]
MAAASNIWYPASGIWYPASGIWYQVFRRSSGKSGPVGPSISFDASCEAAVDKPNELEQVYL